MNEDKYKKLRLCMSIMIDKVPLCKRDDDFLTVKLAPIMVSFNRVNHSVSISTSFKTVIRTGLKT